MTDATDDEAPQHDPLSEEMDLLTFQEADARLYRELTRTKEIVEQLRALPQPDVEEIAAQEQRLDALCRVATRLRNQRTQPPLG
jgi:hypothetical protein